MLVYAGGKTRRAKEHQRQQSVAARTASRGMGDEQRGETNRLAAQVFPQQSDAGRGFVAFIEEEVERREDAIQPRREIFALGDFETDIRILNALLGPRELL